VTTPEVRFFAVISGRWRFLISLRSKLSLETAKRQRESDPDEIETEHLGYLISQDTFYVGYLKGVGRYQ